MPKNYGIYRKESGVYRLQNIMTGNFYIGSTVDLYKRHARHRYVLKNRIKENIRILKDCQKYGEKSFIFGVIEYCEKEKLLEREQHYFETLMPYYNVWKSVYNANGRQYTKEQLDYFKSYKHGPKNLGKFSQSLRKAWVKRKEKYSPEELSKKMANARRGILHSEETKLKLKEIWKQRKLRLKEVSLEL